MRNYDPFSSDPSPAYADLRSAENPLHHYQGDTYSFYVLSRYADVRRTLTTPSVYSMKYGQMHNYIPGQGLTVDPPVHTIIRRLLNPLFAPARIGLLAGRIEQIANDLVDTFADRGAGDFYADFSSVYPVHVAAEIMGIDPSHKDDFRRWTFNFTAGLNSGDQEMENGAREAVYAYFSQLMAGRRAALARNEQCPDDLITTLVTGQHPEGRPFRDDELLPTAMLLLTGGIDTTSLLLTNCLYRLLSDRTLWDRVCADAELVPVAIEESLRYDSPVFGTFRTNDEPVDLHGQHIEPDTKFQMLFASANHDPAVFPDPDSFSLDRDLLALRRDHLAFGGGIHACIGSALARLSARMAITVLSRRLASLELAGTPRRYTSVPNAIAINNGIVGLPIRWTQGA